MDYSTTAEINTSLSSYALEGDVKSSLQAYSPTADITESLSAYTKANDIEQATVSSANTASRLAEERTIKISGDAVGNAKFDGSQDITINLEVNRAKQAVIADVCETAEYATEAGTAAKATLAGTAENCTGHSATANRAAMADQDGSGNNIIATYATKKELEKVLLKLPNLTLSMVDDVLFVNNNGKIYQFTGTEV